MGLIEIRSRTERLGNLGGVRETDVQTGAARAYAGMADAIAQDGKTKRALAGGIAGLFDDAKKLAVQFAEAQERHANEEADRYVARFQEGMNAYDNGYTDADGNRVAGAMEATPDDTGKWMDANVDYRDKFGDKLRKDLKMSDRAMEIARKRLVGYNLSTQKRWANRAASLDQARRKADGIARENAATEALMNLDGTSDAASRLCWQEWKESGENSLEIAGIPKDSPAAKEVLRKRALGVLGKRLKQRIEDTAASVADLPPDQAKIAFDQLAAELAEDNIVSSLAPDAEFRDGKGGVVADYMRESLGDAPISEFAKAAAKDVDAARRKAVHEAEARRREAREKIVGGFTQLECAMDRDVQPESWADKYEEWGNDEALMGAAPERARSYRDAARKMRDAEKKARAPASEDAVKTTEDGLMGRLLWLIEDRADGRIDEAAAAERQAELWRDYAVAARSRAVGADFPKKFKDNLGRMLNDQQREAMRYTMQLFGFDGETDASGRVTAAARNRAAKDDKKYSAPFEVEHWYGDSKPEIGASDLLRLLDTQWRMLETADKGVDRLKAAKDCALKFKEDWLQGGMNAMIDSLAEGLMETSRRRLQDEEMENGDHD